MKKIVFFLLLIFSSQAGCTLTDPEMMEMLQALQAQNDKLLQDITSMKDQLTALDGKYQVILAGLADNKKELEALKSQMDGLKAQIASQLVKLNELTAQLEVQGADLEKLSAEIVKIKARIEELKALMEELLAGKSPIPTNGLVAWYPFNGNANDESGNGNNGTVNGANLTSDRNGNSNSAYYFSSANCSTRIDAQINTISIQTGLTIAIWVMRSGNGCIGPRILEFWPGSNSAGQAQWGWDNSNNNNTSFGSTTSKTVLYSNFSKKPNNIWTHLVYANDGSFGRFYQDGVIINTLVSSGNITLAGNAAFGRMNHPAFDAFNGKLDDIGIWNRALKADEIVKIYKGEKF